MQITKTTLRRIIQEEIKSVINEDDQYKAFQRKLFDAAVGAGELEQKDRIRFYREIMDLLRRRGYEIPEDHNKMMNVAIQKVKSKNRG